MKSLRNLTLALMIPLALAISGCGGGGAKVETQTTTVTLGQQLMDLQAAYDKKIITEKEYNETKKNLLDMYNK
jgi:hypothetical protein